MKEKLKKIKNSRILSLFGILLFIAVCIGVGAFAAYVQHEADPTECAVQYFRAFVQKDYNKMYESLDREEGYYINKKMFCDTIRKMRESYVIDTYEIKNPEKENGVTTVTVNCENNQTKESRAFIIYIQERRKGLQIVPDYYISPGQMMVENFSVVVSSEEQLQLNGETITEKMADITRDKSGNKVYRMKGALFGDYEISATNPYYAVNTSLNLKKADTRIDLTKGKKTANEKYTKEIKENVNLVINQFYKAVRDRNPDRKKLQQIFTTKKIKEKIKELVEKSQEIVYWPERKNIDKYKVIDMKIGKIGYDIRYQQKDKTYQVVCSYQYNYVSSTDTALYTSYVYRLSGTCKSELSITYGLQKDKLVIRKIELENKNKKDDE